ncbi:cyclin-dependent kinase inhibitor 7 isoform X1 [Lactuca sativa]|uniref:Cyclin-dependent kinase inhibitor n=1 Tax=Lactuca sativa TaxID=4236 RepID=A0A9R1VKD0_LACSA|nr:cyclin-dependent kinase inhibitor 7 isoform X1 [Lactuca sativa]XP_042758791.1 cyclin-dependent kinase inhibitor 7 isoform X1 [Lactuca sativa]KAJ0206613.1 hypothetical protein LSAT_V11C500270770 [Lactuca sativa]
MDDSKLHSGVRRSRETEATSSGSGKRRRFDPLDQENAVQLENQCRSGVDVNFPEDIISSAESDCCDHVLSSQCFNNDLSLDLKAELRFQTETSMSSNDGFSRDTCSLSELCGDSEEMESPSTMKTQPPASAPPPPQAAATSRRKPVTVSNLPTAAEIDEFFSIAEKKEQKRFADKYNYDIVNDVPMEGRYQWVRLKP